MTEAEWFHSWNPEQLADSLWGKTSTRKLRLFACACCRRVWNLILPDDSKAAVEVTERYADGLATEEKLRSTYYSAVANTWCIDTEGFRANSAAEMAATVTYEPTTCGKVVRFAAYAPRTDYGVEIHAQRELLHDILGNPFRPVAFDPNWRTSDVTAIARGMYETRDFAAMPILADALQDAGCENADVLDHCRGPGPHVRGCWVVDLILGKE